MKNSISIVIAFVLIACQNGSETLATLYGLPKKLKEVSGIVYAEKDDLFWTLEDKGNANQIYGLNAKNGAIEKLVILL